METVENGPMRRLCLAVVIVAAHGLVVGSPAASAHLRSGTVAVDYRATVTSASTAAYTARIYQSDHGLTLIVRPGHAVAMNGYLGEPVFRLDAQGLWVNAASPTAVVAGLVNRKDRVATSTPRWLLQPHRTSVTWHDARVQRLPQGIDRGAWSIPLTVDGRPGRLEGTLARFQRPSLPLWLALLAAVLAAGAAPLLARRRDLLAPMAIGFAIVAAGSSAVIALAFALDSYDSPGTWIEGADSMVFLAIGLAVLLRGPESLRVGAALGIGLVALAVGLLNGAVLLHSIVLAVLPGTVMRLAVTAAIGGGLVATVLGCLFYAETGVSSLAHELDRRMFQPSSSSRSATESMMREAR
jgi:hypothetical protein